ncbi:cupredoxin domain-containing protein [Telluribacter sp. SYSU D00476]|uniref:cupredoxin domain-containing protein n=1 Tax=Telluribacter sp. SYSU D00476 TaxID=2811430 RepID=UPI001FF52CBC|nr:cupredoxin domain-containing protein [Telluribacter sp. SYSU D00476]
MGAAAGGPDFYLTTVILALIVVTLVAGVFALIFNYRSGFEHVASRWAGRSLYMLMGVVLGVYFLYYLLPDSKTALTGVSAGIPTLTMLNPEETIHVEAGKPVVMKVKNESPFAIALHIDDLGVHTVIASGERLITLNPSRPGHYKYIGTMCFHGKETPAHGLRTPGGKLLEGVIVAE